MEHVFLPRLPTLSGSKPHDLALQGQATIRQNTSLQDALPGTLPSSHTPTWLIHPLDVHLSVAFPGSFPWTPLPQIKTNLDLVPAMCSTCSMETFCHLIAIADISLSPN